MSGSRKSPSLRLVLTCEHADHRIPGVDEVGDGLLRLLLDLRVHREADGQAASEQAVLAVLPGAAEVRGLVRQQHPLGVVADERVAGVRAVQPVLGDLVLVERLGLGGLALGLGDLPQLDHAVDHVVAAFQRDLRVLDRVGRDRVADQTRKHGRLGQVQVLRGDPEVVLRRSLHAVRAVAVVADVQVALEDLLLGVLVLQSDREPQFTDLAGEGVLGGGCPCLGVVACLGGLDQDEPDVLLGDARAALGHALRGAHQCAQGALQVDRAVLEEAVVLDRDLCLLHDRRDVRQRLVDPVLAVEIGDKRPVCHLDAGAL